MSILICPVCGKGAEQRSARYFWIFGNDWMAQCSDFRDCGEETYTFHTVTVVAKDRARVEEVWGRLYGKKP